MASILLIGTEAALLEGVAQALATAGHVSRLASSLADGRELAAAEPPLVALISRELASAAAVRVPLSPGGALLLYHTTAEPLGTLPPALIRVVLADLALPLERHRLILLVQRVEERAATRGSGPPPDHPEQSAR